MDYEPEVLIISARVTAANGAVASYVERVEVGGGGVSYIGPNGTPEERIHPSSVVYNVRFISPDRMVPDQLRAVDSYDEACALAIKYAANLNDHAQRVADLAHDLEVD